MRFPQIEPVAAGVQRGYIEQPHRQPGTAIVGCRKTRAIALIDVLAPQIVNVKSSRSPGARGIRRENDRLFVRVGYKEAGSSSVTGGSTSLGRK